MKKIIATLLLLGSSTVFASSPVQMSSQLESTKYQVVLKGYSSRDGKGIEDYRATLIDAQGLTVERDVMMNTDDIRGITSGIGKNFQIYVATERDLVELKGFRGFVELLEQALGVDIDAPVPQKTVRMAIALFTRSGIVFKVDTGSIVKVQAR